MTLDWLEDSLFRDKKLPVKDYQLSAVLRNERANELQKAKVAKGHELAERFVNTSELRLSSMQAHTYKNADSCPRRPLPCLRRWQQLLLRDYTHQGRHRGRMAGTEVYIICKNGSGWCFNFNSLHKPSSSSQTQSLISTSLLPSSTRSRATLNPNSTDRARHRSHFGQSMTSSRPSS